MPPGLSLPGFTSTWPLLRSAVRQTLGRKDMETRGVLTLVHDLWSPILEHVHCRMSNHQGMTW